MKDRSPVRGALLRGVTIQVVVEDGFDRTVGAGADVNGAGGGGLEPFATEGLEECGWLSGPAQGWRSRLGDVMRPLGLPVAGG
jgi:hypothetical protein